MIFDLESLILSRLTSKLPVGTVLVGTFGAVDLTDESSHPIVCQLQFERALGSKSVPGSTIGVDVEWSFTVYCAKHRASSQQLTDAAALLPAAINALVRWPYGVNQYALLTDGPATVFDDHVLRLGVTFFTSAHFSGN